MLHDVIAQLVYSMSFCLAVWLCAQSANALPVIVTAVQVIKQLPTGEDQTDGSGPTNTSPQPGASSSGRNAAAAPHWPDLDGQTADGERLPCIADMQGYMRVHFDSGDNNTSVSAVGR